MNEILIGIFWGVLTGFLIVSWAFLIGWLSNHALLYSDRRFARKYGEEALQEAKKMYREWEKEDDGQP